MAGEINEKSPRTRPKSLRYDCLASSDIIPKSIWGKLNLDFITSKNGFLTQEKNRVGGSLHGELGFFFSF